MIIVRAGLTVLPGSKEQTLEKTMKGIRHIGILLTFTLAVISCEREDPSLHPEQEVGRPIVFTAESEWPEISRAAINTSDDIKNVGFRVWGTRTSDPDDSQELADDNAVFGTDGANVTFREGKWQYDNVKDWQGGYYSFASVLHGDQFSGSMASTFSKGIDKNGNTKHNYGATLTIDLTSAPFHLGNSQTDFMYAFHNVDNSSGDSSVVDLVFDHLFSLLTIRIAAEESSVLPQIKSVSVFGIHSSIRGKLTLEKQKEVVIDDSGSIIQTTSTFDNNLGVLLNLAVLSSEGSPYWTKEYSSTDFDYGTAKVITPIENLLFYPETLSNSCSLKIKVVYDHNGTESTKTAVVNSGQWESGNSYVYTLQLSDNI